MNRAPDGATIGERGRISENPRWIMPPEALTQSSDVERWFIRMERYFRAADVPDNRRAAMVQYHMDEAMGDVLSALEVEETDDYDKLKSTLFRVFGAFPQLKDQADGILLQQFEAGIRQDMIKFTILRSAPDSFEKAVKIVAREDLMINHVTAATASASVVTTTADGKKETARMKAKHATALRVGHVANWGTLALTAIHTLEANMVETIHNLGRVPKPSIRLEAAIGGELAVTNAYVMEIVLGGTLHPGPGRKLLANTTLLHPVPKVHCGGPCGAKSANSRSQILVAMEQMLPKEQEAGGKYRRTVSAILEQFSDVLATSDEDLGWTRVIHHAIHTGDAKPVRCSPRRIAYYQRAQWEHALSGAQWYSTLDHASGYWHVEMETRDRENTAFTTPYGLYQFKVMPFGLCNAPATFQRLMETSLRGLVGSKCLVYLDDEVIDRLRKVGLKVKPEKCHLMKRKVYLFVTATALPVSGQPPLKHPTATTVRSSSKELSRACKSRSAQVELTAYRITHQVPHDDPIVRCPYTVRPNEMFQLLQKLHSANRGPHTYRVRHQERRRRTMVVHSDRLKEYVTQEDADETRRRPFPLWYGSGTYPKEQQPKENEAELGHAGGSYHRSLSKTAEP
ncbi:Retrovirus-related Pol polyprotein from transposon 17.6 [Trichinella sp. T6]|nr:Retrovirus-related Pol polyprotein from transposon 17.6 [Trichinella sp. T6]